MILLFYFGEQSNTWYSLPVIVLVCLIGVIGAVIIITLFKFILLLSDTTDTVTLKMTETNKPHS